jgi:hypothetical protein
MERAVNAGTAAIHARTDARAAALRSMLREGLNVRAAAQRLGMTEAGVRSLAKRRGISLRAEVSALHLVADDRALVWERRRGDCARLAACEMEWIQAHGSEQARCPTACSAYRERGG